MNEYFIREDKMLQSVKQFYKSCLEKYLMFILYSLCKQNVNQIKTIFSSLIEVNKLP